MYEPHPKLTTPADSEVIWRYVDIASFLSLIGTGTLYFRRCDKFDDKWEGCYSLLPALLAIEDEHKRTRAIRSLLARQEDMRSTTFANCWHRSSSESAAMWEIYTPRGNGLAIRSTVGRLKESLNLCAHRVWIGQVIYGPFDAPDLIEHNNVLPPFFAKQQEYAFESEVRALINSRMPPHRELSDAEPTIGPNDDGTICPVDTRRLIESVLVSPRLGAHVVALIRSVLDRFGFADTPVNHSRLAPKPMTLADVEHLEPRQFTLTMRMPRELVAMLRQACEDYHQRHHQDKDAFIHSVELLNAVNHAAHRAGYGDEQAPANDHVPPTNSS